MIFDNNIKEEELEKNTIGNLGNKDLVTNTYNQTDKINQMLFSQVNTPTKIINPNFKNEKNHIDHLRSNSTNKNLASHEKKINENFNSNISIFKKNDEVNKCGNTEFSPFEEKTNINYLKKNLALNYENEFPDNEVKNHNKIESKIKCVELNNFQAIDKLTKNYHFNKNFETPNTKIYTSLKKNQTVSLISNSHRSNLSRTFGLNQLSLNLVHRGLIMYHNTKKMHFRSRVLKGPPICLRWVSWLVLNNIPVKRNEEIVDFYLSKNIDKDLDKLIIKDIDRTFSKLNSNYFNEILLKNSLYRILKAYAGLDNEIGYCQGLNLISAFLLIVCNYNEKDVFYILISLLSNTNGNNFLIRGFFSEEFPTLKLYVFYFEEIFEKYNKKLKNHFDKLDLPLDTWASKWFQTLFTICLPVEMCQRVWDCLFAYGPYFIFSFTLALLKEFETNLITKNENIEILDFFNNMQNNLSHENVNQIINSERNSKAYETDKKVNNNEMLLTNKNNVNINNGINKFYFSIEAVIKQALKIKFPDKLFQKLKKKYFITNNITKDFTDDKIILKIQNEDIENYTKDFGVDIKNNLIKTMSSNIKKSDNLSFNTDNKLENFNFNNNDHNVREFNYNKNALNSENKNVNDNKVLIKDLPDLINDKTIHHNIDEDNNLISHKYDLDENNRLIKNIEAASDVFNRDHENKKMKLSNGESNIEHENIKIFDFDYKSNNCNSNDEKKNEKKINNNQLNLNYEKNNKLNSRIFNQELVISVDDLKTSPRFKTTTASSKKLNKNETSNQNTKKDFYENAIINTDLNFELNSSFPIPEDENLDFSNFKIHKDSVKINKNMIDLKPQKLSDLNDFDIKEFEGNINSESYTVSSLNNLNSENYLLNKNPLNQTQQIENYSYNKSNCLSNENIDISIKPHTENVINFLNRNITIDNQNNKINLKTESNIINNYSITNNNYLQSDNLYINTISDIRKSNNISNINEYTDHNFEEEINNPFSCNSKKQITHEDINKSILNFNYQKKKTLENIDKNIIHNQTNKVDFTNKSNLFNNCRTSNANIDNLFEGNFSRISNNLNSNSNSLNTNSNINMNNRPSGNKNSLYNENIQFEKDYNRKNYNDLNIFFNERNHIHPNKNIKSNQNLHSDLNLNLNLKTNPTTDLNGIGISDKCNTLENIFIKNTGINLNDKVTKFNSKIHTDHVIKSNVNSGLKKKNDNFKINTRNLQDTPKIKLQLTLQKCSVDRGNKDKNSYKEYQKSNLKTDFHEKIKISEEQEPKTANPIDEYNISGFNSIMNKMSNLNFENSYSKHSFDPYNGNRNQKNEIKDAIFKRRKNNPVYIWKKN